MTAVEFNECDQSGLFRLSKSITDESKLTCPICQKTYPLKRWELENYGCDMCSPDPHWVLACPNPKGCSGVDWMYEQRIEVIE